MNGLEVLGGFDKILQGELVKRNIRIAFAKEAVVFDEKVTKAHELRNQRTRWIHAYFKFLHYGFINLFLGVKNLCFNQFYFGLNHLRPPLFILAIVSLLFMISDLLYSPVLSVIWLFAGLMFAGNFSLILKLNKADQKIWYSLIRIPLFIYSQILSLINFKKASKKFIATEHSQWLTLNDVMKREIN
jgi:cellulose synthase/poly-beta-1,6-N-acetylglucosamine synthase-like glycosyltransferase